MIKKMIALCLCAFLLLGGLVGCGKREEDGRIKIVCTVFPIYDWVRNIVGETEGVEIVLLVNNGTDLHSYQPTAADMIQIASCELFLYVGGTSDSWVQDALATKPDGERVELNLMEATGVVLRQISADSLLTDCEGDACGEHDHDHGETDEHLWLSLRNAAACTSYIAEQIGLLDAANAEQYEKNAASYLQELKALDAAYAATVAEALSPSLLFADRFPFVYLAEDYGIRYAAAFEGCTTETDATPATIIRLAERVDAWGLRYIMVTESSDRKLARSVIGASKQGGQTVVALDSMQSVTADRIDEGATYLGIMQQNLTILRQVLLH